MFDNNNNSTNSINGNAFLKLSQGHVDSSIGVYLIRLQRTYNFLLFHAIILPVLDVYVLY